MKEIITVIGLLCLVNGITNMMLMQSQEKFEEEVDRCLRDVDNRITTLEQSLSVTDTAVIKALQGANESLYEIKILKGEIIK